jgi:hypothetical protein
MTERLSTQRISLSEALEMPLYRWPEFANSVRGAEADLVVEELLAASERAERLALFLCAYLEMERNSRKAPAQECALQL